jgi:DNA-binding MarR family transcriptional regulator
MSLWLRLLKTHNLILREVRQGLPPGITLPQFDVLAQLARSPEGMTFRELSRHLLVSAGNITGIVDRLEKEGLVRREVVAHDRRSFMIRMTPAGNRRIAALVPRHKRDLERILSPIPSRTQEDLRRLLARAAGLIESRSAAHQREGGTRARRAG